MKKRLFLLVAFFLFLATPVTSSSHYDWPEGNINYGDDLVMNYEYTSDSFTISCDPQNKECIGHQPGGGHQPDAALLEIKGCPGSFSVDASTGEWDDDGNNEVRYGNSAGNVPGAIPCSLHEGEIKLTELDPTSTVASGGSIEVQPKDMDAHKGKSLRFAWNVDGGELENFFLSSSCKEVSCGSSKLEILIHETDPNPFNEGDDVDYIGVEGRWDVSNPFIERTTSDRIGNSENDGVFGQIVHKNENNQCFGTSRDTGDACGAAKIYRKSGSEGFYKSNTIRFGDPSSNGKTSGSSFTPVHEFGEAFPDGEIVAGHYPEFYAGGETDASSEGGPYFFICREGADMEANQGPSRTYYTTSQVVAVPSDAQGQMDLYKCQQSSEEWEKVPECDDGLDNDGDGERDYPEPGCKSEGDDSEDNPKECKPVIVREEDSGILRAQYGGGTMSGSEACAGGSSDTQTRLSNSGIDDVPTETFTCEENNIDRPFCSSTNRTYGSHDENPSIKGSQISAVKYHPDDVYINALLQKGENSVDDLSGFNKKMMNRFVDKNGWKPALMAVDAGYHGVESTDLYGGGSPHDENYWLSDQGRGMVDGDGNGYTSSSAEDSWIVSNAGDSNSKVGDPTFPGGFAGKCPSGENWILEEGEWQCSGRPPWPQAVMTPEIDYVGDKATLGFIIMPYNWADSDSEPDRVAELDMVSWKTAWDNFYRDKSPSADQNLVEVTGACYPSDSFTLMFDEQNDLQIQNDSAVEGVDYFRMERNMAAINDYPLPVYGNVTMRSNKTYSCEWKYDQGSKNNAPRFAGTVVPLQKHGYDQLYGGVNVSKARNYFVNGEGESGFSGYKALSKSYGAGKFFECVKAMENQESCGVNN